MDANCPRHNIPMNGFGTLVFCNRCDSEGKSPFSLDDLRSYFYYVTRNKLVGNEICLNNGTPIFDERARAVDDATFSAAFLKSKYPTATAVYSIYRYEPKYIPPSELDTSGPNINAKYHYKGMGIIGIPVEFVEEVVL